MAEPAAAPAMEENTVKLEFQSAALSTHASHAS